MSDGPGVVEGVEGTIRIATERGRQGQIVGGKLDLEGWEAVVVERGDDVD
jgi:hypothetical protein